VNGIRSTINSFFSRHSHYGLFYGRSAGFFSFAVFLAFVTAMFGIFVVDFLINLGGK
jgi:hypothetical protein